MALYDIWNKSIFFTIVVEPLIIHYGPEDPCVDDRGAFENETLRGLYIELVSSGSVPLIPKFNS